MSSFHQFIGALVAIAGATVAAHAQWQANSSVQRLGLYGPEWTTPNGTEYSTVNYSTPAGVYVGRSQRGAGGADIWTWSSTLGVSQLVGLTTNDYVGASGIRNNGLSFVEGDSFVAGYVDLQSAAGRDAWVWNGQSTSRVGLTTSDYVSTTNGRFSEVQFLAPSGIAAGRSSRNLSTTINTGQDSWLWNGSSTQQVGLVGAGYLSSAGNQYSAVRTLGSNGIAAGVSIRYNASGSSQGDDAWAWNGTSTVQIGLTNAAYTSANGQRFSNVLHQLDTGHVIGTSRRFQFGTTTDRGQDTWAWNGTATQRIGPTGTDYSGTNGYQFSEPLLQNSPNHVVGRSFRKPTSQSTPTLGYDVWTYSNGTTQLLGLLDPDHTIGASRYHTASLQNSAGHVAGLSVRTLGGSDAWVWNGSTSSRTGLDGSQFQGSTGYKDSQVLKLAETGLSAGYTSVISGVNTTIGQRAWVWDRSSNHAVGLVGPDYTSTTGAEFDTIAFLSDSGKAAGTTRRYLSTSQDRGAAAWVWNGTESIRTGLTDAAHTNPSGVQVSNVLALNNAGVAAGSSSRYTGTGSANGADTWYFDPTTAITHLVVSNTNGGPSGFAFSAVSLLTEDGFLLGTFRDYSPGADPIPTDLRAFVYRPDLGFTRLSDLVTGGLSSTGWKILREASFASSLDTIVGEGYLLGANDQSQAIFALVPAPSSLVLLATAGLALSRRRR